MTTSPRFGFTYLTSGQATPETSVNEMASFLEAAAGHFIFKSRVAAAPPGSPVNGDCYLVAASPTGAWAGKAGYVAYYFNTAWIFITVIEGYTAWVNDENVFIGYDGAAWSVLATPSGTYIPLSYLDTDTTLAANSDVKLATQKATKAYVDGMVQGLSWKKAVRAATTANGTLATAYANASAIDGVTLATGDRILLKNQTTGSENGIYTVNASGAPTRATDADAGPELVNATCYVSEGTANADTQWTCSTNATITPGTTNLTFAQLSSGGGGLLASNNLSDIASAATARTNLGAAARTPSIQSVTSSATVTPTFADDQVNITAQAVALALANPTGTALDGWGIAIRIKDNATARAITYGTQYRAVGVTLPTTTVISKTLYLGCVWNGADTKLDVVAVAQEA